MISLPDKNDCQRELIEAVHGDGKQWLCVAPSEAECYWVVKVDSSVDTEEFFDPDTWDKPGENRMNHRIVEWIEDQIIEESESSDGWFPGYSLDEDSVARFWAMQPEEIAEIEKIISEV